MRKGNGLKSLIYPIIALIAILIVWAIAAAVVDAELIIPSVDATFKRLGELFSDGKYWLSVLNTLWRAMRSFLYGTACAVALSLAAYCISPMRKLLDPLVSVLRSTPTMAIILIVILWLGSKAAPVLIAFLITFPLLYANFLAGFDAIDSGLKEMSEVYSARKRDVIFKLYLPSVAPYALDGMKSAVSLSIKVTIASEVMAQTLDSMGLYMQSAKVNLDTAGLLACTVTAIVLSYAAELIVSGIKKLVVRWS